MLRHLFVFIDILRFTRGDEMTKSTSDTVADDPLPPHGFNTKAAARYIGMSPSWLRKARMGIGGPGPKFKKVGRRVIYTIDSLKEFLDS